MPTSTSSKNIYLFSALSFFSALCTRLTHLLLSFANLFTFDPTKRLCLSQWGSVVMPPSPILPHTSSYLNWALTGINKDHYTLSFPSLPLPVLNQGHNSKSRSELQLDQCLVYEEEEEPVKKGISQPLWKHHNINCQDLIRAPRTVVHKTSNATCPFLQGCFQMCKSIHTLSPSISSDLSEFELLLLLSRVEDGLEAVRILRQFAQSANEGEIMKSFPLPSAQAGPGIRSRSPKW